MRAVRRSRPRCDRACSSRSVSARRATTSRRRRRAGTSQEGETGQRAVLDDAYPVERRPSGGLWSTVADLVRFGEHHLTGSTRCTSREPSRARRRLRARLVGARPRRPGCARSRGLGRRLPVAPTARARRAARARGADEQLAGQRRDPARRRDARPRAGRHRARAGRPTESPASMRSTASRRQSSSTRDGLRVTEAETDPVDGLAHRTAVPGALARWQRVRLRRRRTPEPPPRLPAPGRRARRLARAAASLVVNAGVAAGHPVTARGRRRDPCRRRKRSGCRSCRRARVVRRRDGHDRIARRRARDLLDAATGVARNLDFFCAVPGLGAEWHDPELVAPRGAVRRGARALRRRPRVVCGAGRACRARRLVGRARPAAVAAARRAGVAAARDGIAMPEAHVACLRMLEPVMTLREGARMYAPGGTLLEPGDTLRQPGLVAALESLAAEGARCAYDGSIASALLELSRGRGGLVTGDDLPRTPPRWTEPRRDAAARAALPHPGRALRPSRDAGAAAVARTLSPRRASRHARRRARRRRGPETHTTNLVAVDADGNACVLTTSLGLGSGDWLPGSTCT